VDHHLDEPVYDGRHDDVYQIGSFGGIYFRMVGGPTGTVHPGHRHHQNHITHLCDGKVRVRYRAARGDQAFKSAVFIGPINFEVAAGVYHEITVLEGPARMSCLFWNEPTEIPFAEERPEEEDPERVQLQRLAGQILRARTDPEWAALLERLRPVLG
jgi:hypothetical protein